MLGEISSLRLRLSLPWTVGDTDTDTDFDTDTDTVTGMAPGCDTDADTDTGMAIPVCDIASTLLRKVVSDKLGVWIWLCRNNSVSTKSDRARTFLDWNTDLNAIQMIQIVL